MSKLTVYACGGAGINLVKPFLKHAHKREAGFAEIAPVMIDTSRSNLRDVENIDNMCYLVEGLDGSGKIRNSNYQVISEKIKDILHQHKPTDFNVVVHSASGGSGSVLGPAIVSELLSRGENVVVMMVGSSDSSIEAQNTINTLKSYEVISNKRSVPVSAVYFENCKDSPRGKVDLKMHTTLVLLAALFSGENRELDSSDLRNFLAFNKVTSFSPSLAYLDFFSKDIEVAKGQAVASVATLTDTETDSAPNVLVKYQAVGFISDAAKSSVQTDLPIHAATIVGYFHDTIDRLTKRVSEINDVLGTVVQKSILADQKVEATDDGLIL